jgi:hypothetical protein
VPVKSLLVEKISEIEAQEKQAVLELEQLARSNEEKLNGLTSKLAEIIEERKQLEAELKVDGYEKLQTGINRLQSQLETLIAAIPSDADKLALNNNIDVEAARVLATDVHLARAQDLLAEVQDELSRLVESELATRVKVYLENEEKKLSELARFLQGEGEDVLSPMKKITHDANIPVLLERADEFIGRLNQEMLTVTDLYKAMMLGEQHFSNNQVRQHMLGLNRDEFTQLLESNAFFLSDDTAAAENRELNGISSRFAQLRKQILNLISNIKEYGEDTKKLVSALNAFTLDYEKLTSLVEKAVRVEDDLDQNIKFDRPEVTFDNRVALINDFEKFEARVNAKLEDLQNRQVALEINASTVNVDLEKSSEELAQLNLSGVVAAEKRLEEAKTLLIAKLKAEYARVSNGATIEISSDWDALKAEKARIEALANQFDSQAEVQKREAIEAFKARVAALEKLYQRFAGEKANLVKSLEELGVLGDTEVTPQNFEEVERGLTHRETQFNRYVEKLFEDAAIKEKEGEAAVIYEGLKDINANEMTREQYDAHRRVVNGILDEKVEDLKRRSAHSEVAL